MYGQIDWELVKDLMESEAACVFISSQRQESLFVNKGMVSRVREGPICIGAFFRRAFSDEEIRRMSLGNFRKQDEDIIEGKYFEEGG